MKYLPARAIISSLVATLPLVVAVVASGSGVSGQAGGAALHSPFGTTSRSSSTATKVANPPGTQLLSLDDGSFESALGVTDQYNEVGSQAVYLNRFTPEASQLPITIDTIAILFPVETEYPTGLMPGMPFEVLVYLDPSSNENPIAASLVRRQAFLVYPSNYDFQYITLDEPVTVDQGTVYIGFTNSITAQTNAPIFPGAIDTDTLSLLSFAFFNTELYSHFDGTLLSEATSGPVVLNGTWLIRAYYSTGGAMRICWSPPTGSGQAPPTDARVCTPTGGGAVLPAAEQGPRDTLIGYNVYRGTSPGVTATPGNFFTSVGPSQTSAGSSVAPGGSFFVVTGVYDTGESSASNEVNATPGVVTSVKVKSTKVVTKGAGFTATVQVFIDGIPFAEPATVKALKKVTQKGNLLTGQSVREYLSSHGGSARMTIRNESGATVTRPIP